MERNSPIGVFDSGVGGLTVLKALREALPLESWVYYADSINAPYGNKSTGEIVELSAKNTEFLLARNVKLIVVACNTATGAAIGRLRESYPLPFVGMEPAVKPAAMESVSKKIGVLATARTFEADHFNNTVNRYAGDVEVIVQVGHGLVELIENGDTETPETRKLLEKYLEPMLMAGIDQLVLGCTHYPFLLPLLAEMLPPGIKVHDPAPAVARQTKRILEANNAMADGRIIAEDLFFTSGNPEVLNKLKGFI
jgi:glutamate racemase